eukprot:scaffold1954_cov113-Isochrysis_galbana.AAC.5
MSGLRPGFWSGTDWMRPSVRLRARSSAVQPAAHLAEKGVYHGPVLDRDALQLQLRRWRRVGDVYQDFVVIVDQPCSRLEAGLLGLLGRDAVCCGWRAGIAVDHAAQREPLLLRLANLVAHRQEGLRRLEAHVRVAALLLLRGRLRPAVQVLRRARPGIAHLLVGDVHPPLDEFVEHPGICHVGAPAEEAAGHLHQEHVHILPLRARDTRQLLLCAGAGVGDVLENRDVVPYQLPRSLNAGLPWVAGS